MTTWKKITKKRVQQLCDKYHRLAYHQLLGLVATKMDLSAKDKAEAWNLWTELHPIPAGVQSIHDAPEPSVKPEPKPESAGMRQIRANMKAFEARQRGVNEARQRQIDRNKNRGKRW